MKKNPNVRLVSRECNIRHYTYRASVCKKTGRLLGVKAGCRRWRNFSEAARHYAPFFPNEKWGEAWMVKARSSFAVDGWRIEARALLSKLKRDVAMVQHRIRRRNKAVR